MEDTHVARNPNISVSRPTAGVMQPYDWLEESHLLFSVLDTTSIARKRFSISPWPLNVPLNDAAGTTHRTVNHSLLLDIPRDVVVMLVLACSIAQSRRRGGCEVSA